MPRPDSLVARARRRLRDRLAGAEPPDAAQPDGAQAVERVRELLAQRRLRKARALTEEIAARPGTAVTTDVCRALLAVNGSLPGVAWTLLSRHDPKVVLRLAPLTLVRAGMASDAAATRALIRQGLDDPTWSPSADDVLGIAYVLLAGDDRDLAGPLVARFQDDLSRARPRKYAAVARWLEVAQARTPDVRDARTDASFVLWDHHGLDPVGSPRTIAPFTDTLSAIVALARAGANAHSSDDAVQSVCDQVTGRIRGGGPRTDLGTVRLHSVPRQFSHLADIPEGTWALVSGPLVRRSKHGEPRFPFDRRILPIFTGVHVDAEVLGRPGAPDYLRVCGPVGCADWNSVFLLRAADVPAFFSGPTALALSVVAASRGSAVIPGSESDRRTKVSWSDPEAPARSLGDNLSAALAAVDELGTVPEGSRVVTGDAAAFWLARSLGLDVRLRVGRKEPVHDGEAGMPNIRLRDLAAAAEARLQPVLSAVLNGEPEDQVRARWREACAPAVAEAEQRARALPPLEPLSWSVADLCADVRRRAVVRERRTATAGEEVMVEVSLDGRLKHQLGVVLDSMVRHTGSPIRLHVLCRDHGEQDFARMSDLFPEVSFVWLPTDTATYGDIGGLLKHITVASMDRLLLPSLLPELPRIIHHDLDAVSRGDLADLFRLDLEGAPLAARDQLQPHGGSFYRSFAAQAERRFRDRPELGSELLLRLSESHPFDQAAFNSGVMVMDLVRMRADSFLETFLPWVTRYGLNDQVLLNAYAGTTRAHLPYEWNHYPRIEAPLADPKIVHWIGSQKPWAVARTAGRGYWLEAEASFAERVRRRG